MTLTLTLPAIVYMIAMVLGTIIASICWIHPHNSRSSIRWLGASILSLTWTLFVFFLSESSLIYYAPHLFQTSFIATLLYLPFSFFFVRSAAKGTPLTWKDLIHALPLVWFLIDYSVIYISPVTEKLQLIGAENHSAYVYQHGWLLPSHLHKPLRFLLFLLYTGLQFRLTLSCKGPEKKWLLSYLTVQFVLVIYYIIYQIAFDPLVLRATNIIIPSYIVFIAVALLFHPHILYSFNISSSAETKLVADIKRIENGEASDGLHKKKMEEIYSRLEAFVQSNSPFLQHGYSIHDLSTALQIPTYQLSAFLNHYVGLSFHEYLNRYRIDHCKKRICEGAAQLLTLEALAYECGFNNRNSFTAAFKHFCGMTPSEFIKLQKKPLSTAKNS
jgi:AraC-like DNA-binding protein